ncbi:hypothetical protein GCM10027059_26690 [Myceligenerans halotolerans]
MTAGATYICGGDQAPGARGTECPDACHDHPLPDGYVDAAEMAGSRLYQGWSSRECPRCGLHGWWPPINTDTEVRA